MPEYTRRQPSRQHSPVHSTPDLPHSTGDLSDYDMWAERELHSMALLGADMLVTRAQENGVLAGSTSGAAKGVEEGTRGRHVPPGGSGTAPRGVVEEIRGSHVPFGKASIAPEGVGEGTRGRHVSPGGASSSSSSSDVFVSPPHMKLGAPSQQHGQRQQHYHHHRHHQPQHHQQQPQHHHPRQQQQQQQRRADSFVPSTLALPRAPMGRGHDGMGGGGTVSEAAHGTQYGSHEGRTQATGIHHAVGYMGEVVPSVNRGFADRTFRNFYRDNEDFHGRRVPICAKRASRARAPYRCG